MLQVSDMDIPLEILEIIGREAYYMEQMRRAIEAGDCTALASLLSTHKVCSSASYLPLSMLYLFIVVSTLYFFQVISHNIERRQAQEPLLCR